MVAFGSKSDDERRLFEGFEAVLGDADAGPVETGDLNAEVVLASAGGDEAFETMEDTADGLDTSADGIGLVGHAEEDFIVGVTEDGTHLAHLTVGDLRPAAIVLGTVGHEAGDRGMVLEELGTCLGTLQGGHSQENLRRQADILHGLGATLLIAAHQGLRGDIGVIAFFPQLVANDFLGVAFDDGDNPHVTVGYASGADSRPLFLCPTLWSRMWCQMFQNISVYKGSTHAYSLSSLDDDTLYRLQRYELSFI